MEIKKYIELPKEVQVIEYNTENRTKINEFIVAQTEGYYDIIDVNDLVTIRCMEEGSYQRLEENDKIVIYRKYKVVVFESDEFHLNFREV